MIGILKALALAESERNRRAVNLRACPFCGAAPRLHEDPVRHWSAAVPMTAAVVCDHCGSQGPTYLYPLCCLKGQPWPEWDPRELAAGAWNGEVRQRGDLLRESPIHDPTPA